MKSNGVGADRSKHLTAKERQKLKGNNVVKT
jgi:hypothetical protein